MNRAFVRSLRWPALCLLMVPLSGCVLVTGRFSLFDSGPQPLEEQVVSGDGDDKILLVDITDVIQSQDSGGAFGMGGRESTTARLGAELKRASEDDAVKAVVLCINSPGGTVTASDAAFQQIMEFKQERRLPVLAHFLDVAASGGYYVALAADEIVASPTSVTGSVGVVMHSFNLEGLLALVGVKDQTIKSGAKKDIGSAFRAMAPDEREILQSVIADMKDRFLQNVRARRPGISEAALETVADGRIVSAPQALALGLVDRVGYLPEVLQRAEERAGIHDPSVVRYRRPREYAESIYSQAGAPPVQVSLLPVARPSSLPPGPNFLYLWSPDAE